MLLFNTVDGSEMIDKIYQLLQDLEIQSIYVSENEILIELTQDTSATIHFCYVQDCGHTGIAFTRNGTDFLLYCQTVKRIKNEIIKKFECYD